MEQKLQNKLSHPILSGPASCHANPIYRHVGWQGSRKSANASPYQSLTLPPPPSLVEVGGAMNYEENRAFLEELRGSKRTVIIEDDSSEGDDSSDATTQPPSPQPVPPISPPQQQYPATPDSSASTVSPPHSPPQPPVPPRLQESGNSDKSISLSEPYPQASSREPGRQQAVRRERTPSSDSSASTVPPPSPGALSRITNSRKPRAVTVSVDPIGIEGLKKESKPSSIDYEYPKLQESRFAPDKNSDRDLILSNRGVRAPNGVLPARISGFLSPFQRDGVTFMYRLFERDRGGLLADSMGLGKTVQTICFLGAAFAIWDREPHQYRSTPKILVVAPISVRKNWQREFETWTPFRVMLYERNDEPNIARRLRDGTADVLITGDNPVAARGHDFFSKPLGKGDTWTWDVVIVDEIHIAKNKNTKIFNSLAALPKVVMFGLTGTAVQNRLNELWNVMSLVVPPTLWPSYKSFKASYTDIINKGTKRDASEYMRRKAQERIQELRRLLAKHMVRRPKSVIEGQLPGKTDYCVLMRMKRDGLQGYMYKRYQDSYDVKMLRDALLPCDCGSEALSKECCHRFPCIPENLQNAPIWAMRHKDGPCEKCPNCICLYLQHFSRWLAAHSLLVLPGREEQDPEKAMARKRVFMYYLGEKASLAREPIYKLERDNVLSCKLNVALKLLKTYESNGNKTIIFYESLRLGEILKLWAERNRLSYEVIDGSVTKDHRQGAVDRFNAEKDISTFFISKKAGATGLNICGADRVLIFEPCWNPTLDLQAGDRAYRLGQKRVVHIIRLVVENTIEHYVFKTALSKSQLSSAVLDNTAEEWHVRDDEVGSMRAMLSMGDVFEGEDDEQEDFKVVEAEELNKGEQVNGGSSANKPLVDPHDEADSIGAEFSSEVDDVFGEDGVCSLDVDIEQREVDQLSSDNVIPATGNAAFALPESQCEADQVLGEGGASKKLVMQSTSVRKRKRQMMGVIGSKRTSGINPAGAVCVNFDEADFLGVSESTSTQKNEAYSDKPINRGRVSHNVAYSGAETIRKQQGVLRSAPGKAASLGTSGLHPNEEKGRVRLEEMSDGSPDETVVRRRRSRSERTTLKERDQRPNLPTQPPQSRSTGRTGGVSEKSTKTRPIAKDSKQKKEAPKSAFAARARTRR